MTTKTIIWILLCAMTAGVTTMSAQTAKSDEALKKIPVVILSISRSEKDIERSYELNANCYVTKPLDIYEFIEVFGTIQNFWLKTVKLPA